MKLTSIEQADAFYRTVLKQAEKEDRVREATAELGKNDLYFLLTRILKRKDIRHPWLFARCKEVQEEPNNCLDLWAREHRKENHVNTDVYTPTGWTKHGKLKAGDEVYSPDGLPVKILATTEIYTDSVLYDITFKTFQDSTTEVITAGSGHIWDVIYQDRTGRKEVWKEKQVTTKEVFEYTTRAKTHKKKRWYKVKYCGPLNKPEIELPIDPYTLGAWLGDGSCGCGSITNGDDEIWDRIGKANYVGDLRDVANTKVGTVHGLVTKLKTIGLYAAKSHSKFIPEIYHNASIEQRTALLQGLMDTDGGVRSDKSHFRYGSTSEQLANNVKRLLWSLGVVANLYTFQSPEEKPMWIVSFYTDGIEPFSTSYHKSRIKEKHYDYNYWYIKDVKRSPNAESNCIQVEGGRYVTGKMIIPTHNSTIITFALTLQDIIKDSELCIVIFSITRPLSKDFLEQIKREAEDNKLLKQLYPDVFYQDPKKESPKWTMDDGLVFKRKGNPRECTLEAHGFIEGLPTGSHFQIRVYDDMIDQKNCTNPDIMKKVIQQWELSLNLGSDRMIDHYGVCNVARYIGTRYHYNDVYGHLLTKDAAKPRIYPATDDGTPSGKPVYFSPALLQEKRDMGSYVFACQMLQDPKSDDVSGFDIEDIQSWWPDMVNTHVMNRYIIVDPASSKKKGSDFTTIMVYGLNVDNNVYLLDGIRDRLNLTERATWMFRMHRKWRPDAVGYEKYGQQADIEHIEYIMEKENYRFTIMPLGGIISKEDRIRRLIPIIEKNRYYVPLKLMGTDYEGKPYDLSAIHLQEFNDFPVSMYDDTIDNAARILDPDLGAEFPELEESLPFSKDVTMAQSDYSLFGD